MSPFAGFPSRMEYTSLPNLFFTTLLPQIDNLAELKVTLHLWWILRRKRGYPRFVSFGEMVADSTLMAGLKALAASPQEALGQALERAEARGTILHLPLEREGKRFDLYSLNTETDSKAMEQIEKDKLPLGRVLPEPEHYHQDKEQPNIFTLYEQNIGLLTPMIAEELREAEKLYPASWVEEAFRQAVASNVRSWRYIAKILERWSTEGKDNGKPGKYSKRKSSSDKYTQGKYGRLIRR